MPDSPTPVEVVERMFRALEAGDLPGLEAVYADDITVWTNLNPVDADRTASLKLVAWLARTVQGLHYEVTARFPVTLPDGSDGVVQQHVLTGTAPDGTALRAPACLVVAVRDGRISHIDEYLDGAAVAALARRA